MKIIFSEIANQLSKHFNQSITIFKHAQIFGGDINQTFQLQTNIGSFFLKINESELKDMFEKEFQGLQLLHQTQTIKAPQPVLSGKVEDKIFLVTEFIHKGNPSENFWQTFAEQLAALHQHSSSKFGLSTNNYIGSLHQRNNLCNTWNEFYANQRILPLTQLAYSHNKLNKEDVALIEKLCKRLYNLFPEEKSSLIHGDLWSGNFMSDTNNNPVIYDPAVYYGNREMDIAMSLLFGGFDNSFYNFYNEVFRLQPGWKERIKLCQLYPLLVHLNLFGGHYYYNVIDIVKSYA